MENQDKLDSSYVGKLRKVLLTKPGETFLIIWGKIRASLEKMSLKIRLYYHYLARKLNKRHISTFRFF